MRTQASEVSLCFLFHIQDLGILFVPNIFDDSIVVVSKSRNHSKGASTYDFSGALGRLHRVDGFACRRKGDF
jgi:hypothetical protein